MILEGLEIGPFMSNTFIVGCKETSEAALFDPGADPDRILKWVKRTGLTVKAIYATHAHIDHIGAVADLKKEFDAPFKLHKNEEILVKAYDQQCMMFGVRFGSEPAIDGFIDEGDEIKIGNITAKALLTPGHSPGGLCFLFPGKVIVGDTLFLGSIGRTDLIGGNTNQLLTMIRTKLFTLPDETEVYCGHGPETSIGHEKKYNPFLNA